MSGVDAAFIKNGIVTMVKHLDRDGFRMEYASMDSRVAENTPAQESMDKLVSRTETGATNSGTAAGIAATGRMGKQRANSLVKF